MIRQLASPGLFLALALLSACATQQRSGQLARPGQLPNDAAFRACAAQLNAEKVRFAPLPNRPMGNGCAIENAVQLLDIGTPVANLGPMRCDLAARFAAWTRHAVQPAARAYLGSEVVKVETFGTYACRNVRGTGGTIAGRRSEHASANAVDVAAFLLADGRRISVLRDWQAEGPTSAFLRRIRESACKRFGTVLSPDYNAAHRDHLHFDLGPGRPFCR